jgi:hypothetical protein
MATKPTKTKAQATNPAKPVRHSLSKMGDKSWMTPEQFAQTEVEQAKVTTSEGGNENE